MTYRLSFTQDNIRHYEIYTSALEALNRVISLAYEGIECESQVWEPGTLHWAPLQ